MRYKIAGMILAVSLVLLGISEYFLIDLFLEEREDDMLQEQLKEIYEESENEDTPEESEGDENDRSAPSVRPGLLALHKKNPDCIGWLQIEGTVIDYPVMYHPEKENYYLHRDFNEDYSANGCLFLSELCNPDTSDNLIIYGHHMNSGKMFAALDKYKSSKFYREHPLISYNTLQGEETYQIFAVFRTPVYTGNDFPYYTFTKAESISDYQEYIKAVKERSIYDTGNAAVFGDKLLTLSTCEYSQRNGRIVVVAKRIR
ncbi:class B sortase [Lachnospiraceae bacterium MD308]|nr:class B sortase [Lachnospiraceae bacterium MD308]